MTTSAKWCLAGLFTLFVTFATHAAELGMPAPELQISDWIKGDKVEVKEGKGKNIYIVEFWATWCAPCRTTIPHLTELQKKYKDKNLVVVGITSDENLATVRRFVEKMGNDMDYIVALDSFERTTEAYMKAFDQSGIPYAFVIDKSGAIVWHGHPSTVDKVVDEVIAGTFNNDADKKASHAKALIEQYLELVKVPERNPKAEELGKEIIRDGASDPRLLNEFAWTILMKWSVQQRDIPLALEASKKAVELTGEKMPAMLDTHARALFMSGRKEDAIRVQKQAIALCPNNSTRGKFEESLQEYQQ